MAGDRKKRRQTARKKPKHYRVRDECKHAYGKADARRWENYQSCMSKGTNPRVCDQKYYEAAETNDAAYVQCMKDGGPPLGSTQNKMAKAFETAVTRCASDYDWCKQLARRDHSVALSKDAGFTAARGKRRCVRKYKRGPKKGQCRVFAKKRKR